jgi:hypothetical protein
VHAVNRNAANQPVARYFDNGIQRVSDIEMVPSVPFLEERIATKGMKWISFPNIELSIIMALMNIILSKADIDRTFNSYLNPYLFHIFCCIFCSFLNICISVM